MVYIEGLFLVCRSLIVRLSFAHRSLIVRSLFVNPIFFLYLSCIVCVG